MKQLFSMAKTFGKHLWDQNKSKIIDKGLQLGKNIIGKKKGVFANFLGKGLDGLDKHMRENNYDMKNVG